MNGIRKLLSLNLALIFLLTGFAATPAGAEGTQGLESGHRYEKYIIVDGVEYDVTKNPSGPGWRLYYYDENYEQQLHLNNYQGGSIYTNVSLSLSVNDNNTITGNDGYGIYVAGDLFLNQSYSSGINGTLTVNGGHGHAAIYATGTLLCNSLLTASGDSTSALIAKVIRMAPIWPNIISVGSSPKTAVAGIYDGENYINISYIPYVLTLDGNGGTTQDSLSKGSLSVSFTTGTPGYLHLYPYEDTFKNHNSLLLGWTDNKDGTGRFHTPRGEYKFPEETLEATIYACWEDETNKAVILNEYCSPDGGNTWTKIISCKKVRPSFCPNPQSLEPFLTAGWPMRKAPSIPLAHRFV